MAKKPIDEWDFVTGIPTPHADLLDQLVKRLSMLYLRENGMLDLEGARNPGEFTYPRDFWSRIDHHLSRIKDDTIALNKLLKEVQCKT